MRPYWLFYSLKFTSCFFEGRYTYVCGFAAILSQSCLIFDEAKLSQVQILPSLLYKGDIMCNLANPPPPLIPDTNCNTNTSATAYLQERTYRPTQLHLPITRPSLSDRLLASVIAPIKVYCCVDNAMKSLHRCN